MIVELRRYQLVPGGARRYLDSWRVQGRAPQVQHLGEPLGVFTTETGDLNTLVFLWQFDGAGDREARRTALAADTEFAEFRRTVRDLVVHQHTEILSPAPSTRTERR